MSTNNVQKMEVGFAALAITVLLIGTATGSAMFLLFASCLVLLLQLVFQRRDSIDKGALLAAFVGGLAALAIAVAMLMR